MAKSQTEKVLTALAGEYLVAGHLSMRGLVASLTLKNYPKVDIFALNPTNGKQVAIQVKTTRSNAYYLPEKIPTSQAPFVFVHISPDLHYDFFIVKSDDLEVTSTKEREEYLKAHPTVRKDQPRMITLKNLQPYRDAWHNLELD